MLLIGHEALLLSIAFIYGVVLLKNAVRAGHSVAPRFGYSGVLFELIPGVDDKDDISSSLLDASSMAFGFPFTTLLLIAAVGDVLLCFFAAL